MFCKNCGQEVDENKLVCPSCGCEIADYKNTALEKASSNDSVSDTSKGSDVYSFGVFISVCVFLVGIAFIFFDFFYNYGATEHSYTYGGDAYTGIQNAAAQAATNVYYLTSVFTKGIGVLISSIGAVSFCYFKSKK